MRAACTRAAAVGDGAPQPETRETSVLARLAAKFASLFPLWVVLGSTLALLHPPAFTWFAGPLVPWALGFTMLATGITIRQEDLDNVLRQPWLVLLGTVLQFTVMPLTAFVVGQAAAAVLPSLGGAWRPEYSAGIILLGCCPGGTASNIVTFLAKGDVALSVSMTSASTFAAVVMTPLLTKSLVAGAGSATGGIVINGAALLKSTLTVVLLPTLLGIFLQRRIPPRRMEAVSTYTPVLAVSAVTFITSSMIARSQAAMTASGVAVIVAAVFILHSLGFSIGYALSRYVFKQSVRTSITNSIEVGMQNSALGAVLAAAHLPNGALAAVPCALSAAMHSVIGSTLAARWASRKSDD